MKSQLKTTILKQVNQNLNLDKLLTSKKWGGTLEKLKAASTLTSSAASADSTLTPSAGVVATGPISSDMSLMKD